MMDKKLKWRHLKALNQIYGQGFTKNKIKEHPYINYLVRREILKPKIGKPEILEKGFNFDEYYLKEHLSNFEQYETFLSKNTILSNQSNYSERDIQTLIFIQDQKDQILEDQYSRRKFSAVFFKQDGSKHLDDKAGLEKAVLTILGIDSFPGNDPKDQQYKFVLNCPSPERIVLCENIDFLLMPWIARENNIELWYAGGNNIEKLDHLPEIDLPIYYSCDWDYDGLKIYERIKNKIPEIQLLLPSSIDEKKSVNSPNHYSRWKENISFSGLNEDQYSNQATELIRELIRSDKWIEEESNDLVKMIELN